MGYDKKLRRSLISTFGATGLTPALFRAVWSSATWAVSWRANSAPMAAMLAVKLAFWHPAAGIRDHFLHTNLFNRTAPRAFNDTMTRELATWQGCIVQSDYEIAFADRLRASGVLKTMSKNNCLCKNIH